MKKSELDYSGVLSSEVRVQLTDLLSAVAIANLGKRKDLRRLCSIAIELLDNAQRHCTDNNITFTWRIEGETLVVVVENSAREEDARRLKEQVDALHTMNAEEIANEFKRQLMNPEFTPRGGAGLGLLQIAKKGAKNYDVSLQKGSNGQDYICTSTVYATLSSPAA
ncbi:MAG: DUF6272 family protein [Flavobacteriales bacterium]